MASASEKSFRFESDAQAAACARESVREVAIGLPADTLADVLLCVTELVTNSVTHAGAAENEPVELAVRLDG